MNSCNRELLPEGAFCLYHVGDASDLSNGYVGVTKRINERRRDHLNGVSNISNFVSEHTRFSVLCVGSKVGGGSHTKGGL